MIHTKETKPTFKFYQANQAIQMDTAMRRANYALAKLLIQQKPAKDKERFLIRLPNGAGIVELGSVISREFTYRKTGLYLLTDDGLRASMEGDMLLPQGLSYDPIADITARAVTYEGPTRDTAMQPDYVAAVRKGDQIEITQLRGSALLDNVPRAINQELIENITTGTRLEPIDALYPADAILALNSAINGVDMAH